MDHGTSTEPEVLHSALKLVPQIEWTSDLTLRVLDRMPTAAQVSTQEMEGNCRRQLSTLICFPANCSRKKKFRPAGSLKVVRYDFLGVVKGFFPHYRIADINEADFTDP